MSILGIQLVDKFLGNFGYIEDGPGNDLKYSNSPMITTPMADNPSVKQYFRSINNQYTLSACVANATADAFEAQLAHRDNIAPDQIDELSRLFIYWNARNLENPPTCDKDSGARIRLAFDSMARYGTPFESIYPYDLDKVNQRPTILAYREAVKNRIDKFYRIDTTGSDRIGQIKQALCSGNPVVFGTRIAESFKAVNSDAVVTDPGGGYMGGHCMCCVSWSDEKKAFEIRNSWGINWGCEGYCWMDQNYLAADITTDLWVPTV